MRNFLGLAVGGFALSKGEGVGAGERNCPWSLEGAEQALHVGGLSGAGLGVGVLRLGVLGSCEPLAPSRTRSSRNSVKAGSFS